MVSYNWDDPIFIICINDLKSGVIGFTPLFVYAFIGEDDKSFGLFLGAMRASHLTDILRGTANNNTLYIVWIYSREGSSSPLPCTMQ